MLDATHLLPLRIGIASDVVEQTFLRLIHEPWGCSVPGWAAAVDVFETEGEFLITVEAPGVPVEKVEVRAEGTALTISGQRQSARVTRSARAVKLERNWGRFSRTLQLGHPVDLSRLMMCAEEGVLHIRLPKLDRSPFRARRRRHYDDENLS